MKRESIQFKYLANTFRSLISFASLGAAWDRYSRIVTKLPTEEAFHQMFLLQPIIDQLSSFLSPYNFSRRFLWWLRWHLQCGRPRFNPWVRKIPGARNPLQYSATYSSILACTIPRTEGPGRLRSIGLQRVRLDCVTNTHVIFSEEVVDGFLSWVVVLCLPLLSYDHAAHVCWQ